MEPEQTNPIANIQIPQPSNPKQQGQNDTPTISKSQMKKLKRKQLWEAKKKTKKIQKKQKKKLLKLSTPKPPPKQGPKQPIIPQRKRKQQYIQKVAKGLRVVIDLQFFKQMTEKQQSSLFKQLSHCHSLNRNSKQALNLILTSMTPDIKEILDKKYNVTKWGINIEQKNLADQFKQQEIIYLSGDAQEVIQELDPTKVYVIGGIVDHNRLKKITYNYSVENKLKMQRFPLLGDTIAIKSNAHLAVNHVYQVILKVKNGIPWQQAIMQAIPSRKLQDQ